jgi:NADP-dependent 3-hydroxy acid dehydrogenase YdfG
MTTDQVAAEDQDKKIEAMEMMKAGDLAGCVYYVLTQPKRVSVAVVQIRPTMQII